MTSPLLKIEFLRRSLLSLCRICAKLISTRSRGNFDCSSCSDLLKEAFAIDVAGDDKDFHPGKLCEKCHATALQFCTVRKAGKLYRTSQTATSLPPHSGDDCFACNQFCKCQRGGRNPSERRKHAGRPKGGSVDSLERFLHSIAPASVISTRPLKLCPEFIHEDLNAPGVLAELVCLACKDVVDRPVNTKCQHLVCMNCLLRQYQNLGSENEWRCLHKNCEAIFPKSKLAETFFKPYGLVQSSLESLKVAGNIYSRV